MIASLITIGLLIVFCSMLAYDDYRNHKKIKKLLFKQAELVEMKNRELGELREMLKSVHV